MSTSPVLTSHWILFAHGSRDPRWAESFERLRTSLCARWQVSTNSLRVQLAYLEFIQPSLPQAIAQAAQDGATGIAIAPLFLGAGGHIRHDLPELLAQAQAQTPDVPLQLLPILGDMPEWTDAVGALYTPLWQQGVGDAG